MLDFQNVNGEIRMMEQISIFDGTHPFKITKPIRLIELFAGIGAQAKALERLGANSEHYRICEFDKYAVKSYNAIHHTNFQPSDITELRGGVRAAHPF
jgi:DNA (cytosine-5)-methyltransferase 1